MVVIQLLEFVVFDFEFCFDSDCYLLGVLSIIYVMQVYLLDFIGFCVWIDYEGCKEFVFNVLMVFFDLVFVSYFVCICEQLVF